MKILVSTKAMAKFLDQIPENEFVERANMEDGELILISQTKTIRMPVHIMEFEASVRVSDRRWDWVHDLMKQASEQPVTIEIRERRINILFQY